MAGYIQNDYPFLVPNEGSLDKKQYFTSVDEMKAFPENQLGKVAMCTCNDDTNNVHDMFIFNINNEVDSVTGKWRSLLSIILANGGVAYKNITEIHLRADEVATTKIQEALDIGGQINVFIPDDSVAYIDATLQIGDNTELNIIGGTLKEKAGTRNYMIINKDGEAGNKNVKITGKWDVDGENNLPTGGYPGGYPGHAIFLRNMDNLDLSKLKVSNAKKYCILVAGCTNSKFDFIEFDSFSDGLHFNPPCNNLKIGNIFGQTGDDMVSFTLGDFEQYQVSNVGNYENIIVDGVIGTGTGAACCVKITGSGQDSAYTFKNISISNLFGTVTKNAVFIMDDTEDNNLVNTSVHGITIRNISVIGCTNPALFLMPTAGGDITIENSMLDPSDNYIETRGYIDKLILRNIKNTAQMGANFIKMVGRLDELILDGAEVHGNNYNVFLNIQPAATIGKIIMKDVNYITTGEKTGSGHFISNSSTAATTTPIEVTLENVNVDKGGYLFKAETSMNLHIINSVFAERGTPITVSAGSVMRIEGTGNKYGQWITPTLGAATGALEIGKLSINDNRCKVPYDKLTPQAFDIFWNTKASTDPTLTANALCVYNGTAFKDAF